MTETAAAGKGHHFVIRAAQGALVAPIVAILLSYAVQYVPSEFQLGLVWVKRLLLVMGFAAGAYAARSRIQAERLHYGREAHGHFAGQGK